MSDINFRGPPYLSGLPPTTPWGVGQGSDLTPFQVDSNFWFLWQLILSVQSTIVAGIDYFSVVGDSFYVHLTDHMVLGPYPLPVAVWTYRGAWQPFTVYYPLDIITDGGATYIVQYQHTSAATFNPNANDGMGHNYYGLLLAAPINWMPIGGEPGQVLTVVTPGGLTTPVAAWEYLLPLGGTSGQYLTLVDTGSPGGAPITQWVTLPAVLPSGGTAGYILSLVTPGAHPTTTWVPSPTFSFEQLTDFVLLSPIEQFQVLANNGSGGWSNYFVLPLTFYPTVALTSTGTASLDPTVTTVFSLSPTGPVLVTAASVPASARIAIVITAVGSTSYTVSWNTMFKTAGTIATGVSSGAIFTIDFVSDGTNFNEVSRAGPLS